MTSPPRKITEENHSRHHRIPLPLLPLIKMSQIWLEVSQSLAVDHTSLQHPDCESLGVEEENFKQLQEGEDGGAEEEAHESPDMADEGRDRVAIGLHYTLVLCRFQEHLK